MPGKIWEVAQTSGTVSLILSDAAPRIYRRVLLAVDRTDSAIGTETLLRAIITELARVLDIGDVVSIWRMGESDALREIVIRGETSRNELLQAVTTLGEVRSGSWLWETWSAMQEASINSQGGFVDFPIVISDGEIFDIGAIETTAGPAPIWYRLHGGEGTPNPEFVNWAREATASAEGLKVDLAVPALTTHLRIRARGVNRAFSFDQTGKVIQEISVEDLDQIPFTRVALVGGKVVSASLTYSTGRSTTTDNSFDRINVAWPEDLLLQAVLKGIGGGKVRWDRERLNRLVSGAWQFRCQFDGKESPAGQLFCIECGCFLLAVERIKLVDIYPPRWRFPLSDGAVSDAGEASPESESEKAVAVTNDEHGRWLVLDLGAA